MKELIKRKRVFFCFRERIETIDVLFSSLETKIIWERKFLDAKKILCKFPIHWIIF